MPPLPTETALCSVCRIDVIRPETPYRFPASTMRPPITVLEITMNAFAPNATSMSGQYDFGTTPIKNQQTAARPAPKSM